MKKLLTIIAILFAVNCSAQARIPIFKKKKYKAPRCGSMDRHKRSRRQVTKAVGIFVFTAVGTGILLDATKHYK